jgi:hypothetical protein
MTHDLGLLTLAIAHVVCAVALLRGPGRRRDAATLGGPRSA